MLNVIIFGPPGSGKGTQSEKIISEYQLTHISTGDVLRQAIADKTEAGVEAKKFIDQGALVPDELIINMLSDKVEELAAKSKGFIFDGFPRTTAQAEALKTMLANRGMDITITIGLEVDEEVLTERLLLRGKTSGRSDDNLETIKKRIDTYHAQTAPVKDFYLKEGSYVGINGVGSIDDIYANISKAIEAKK